MVHHSCYLILSTHRECIVVGPARSGAASGPNSSVGFVSTLPRAGLPSSVCSLGGGGLAGPQPRWPWRPSACTLRVARGHSVHRRVERAERAWPVLAGRGCGSAFGGWGKHHKIDYAPDNLEWKPKQSGWEKFFVLLLFLFCLFCFCSIQVSTTTFGRVAEFQNSLILDVPLRRVCPKNGQHALQQIVSSCEKREHRSKLSTVCCFFLQSMKDRRVSSHLFPNLDLPSPKIMRNKIPVVSRKKICWIHQ